VFTYHFTNDVRLALAKAREEAQRLNHGYVGTEHLALGVLHTASGVAATLLSQVDRVATIAELERLAERGRNASAEGADLPYTSRAKQVLELAMREGIEFGHETVDTEHLVLALLREEDGIGAQVLREAGLDTEASRAVVVREVGYGRKGRGDARPNPFFLRLLEWLGLVPRGKA
jgi:ATP-dependent Clp protease ATP-binding subunit ClpC